VAISARQVILLFENIVRGCAEVPDDIANSGDVEMEDGALIIGRIGAIRWRCRPTPCDRICPLRAS
jgi:hypothetical protein